MFLPYGRSNRSGSPLHASLHPPQAQTSKVPVAARSSPDKVRRASSRQCAVRTLSENRITAKSPMTCSSTITELNRANQDLRADLSRCLAAVREARNYSERMEDVVVALPDYLIAFKAGMMDLSLLQHALFLENSFVLLQGWEVQQAEERERCENEIASVCEDYSSRLEQSEAEQRDTLDEVQRRWQAVVGTLREENDELSQQIEALEREKRKEKQRADDAEAAFVRREKELEAAATEKRASLVSAGTQVQLEESASSLWDGSSRSESALHTARVALPGQRALPQPPQLKTQTGPLRSLQLAEQLRILTSFGPHQIDDSVTVQEPWTLREHSSQIAHIPPLPIPSQRSSLSQSALHTERTSLHSYSDSVPPLQIAEHARVSEPNDPQRIPSQRSSLPQSALHTGRMSLPGGRILHPSSAPFQNYSDSVPPLQIAEHTRVSASYGPQRIDDSVTVREPWTLRESGAWQDQTTAWTQSTSTTRESSHTVVDEAASIARLIAARFDAWMLLKKSYSEVHRALTSEAYDDAVRQIHRRRLMFVYEKSVSAVITGTTIADSACKSASRLSSQRKPGWNHTTKIRSAPNSPSPKKPSHVVRELSVAFDDEAREEEAAAKKQKKPEIPRHKTPTSLQKENKKPVKAAPRSREKSHHETPTSASAKRRVVTPTSSKREPAPLTRVVIVSTPPSQKPVRPCRTSERKPLISGKEAEEAINEIRALRLELERLQETHRSARVELLASDTTSQTLSATVLQLTDELRFLRSALDAVEHAAAEENATDATAPIPAAAAPTPLEFLALDSGNGGGGVGGSGGAEFSRQKSYSAATLQPGHVHLDALLAAASVATPANTAAANRHYFETLAPMLVEFIRTHARDVCSKEAVTQLPPPQPLATPPAGWKDLYTLPWDTANSAARNQRAPDLDDWAVACERASQWCALFLMACTSLYHLHTSVEEKYITMEKQQWDKRVVRKVVGDIRTSVGRMCTDVAQADWAEYKQRFPAFFRSASSNGGGGSGAVQPQHQRRSNSRIASSLLRPANDSSIMRANNFSANSRLSMPRTMSATRGTPLQDSSNPTHAH